MSKKLTDRKTYKKVPIEDRIQMVESLYINFPRNQSALNAIGNCHSHAKLSKEPEGILILGDTGAGKTTVVKLYMQSHVEVAAYFALRASRRRSHKDLHSFAPN